jgi:predicted metalloprotease
MRWKRGRGTSQIEDRRGQGAVGGGGLGFPIGAGLGGAGIVIVVVILLLNVLLGGGGFGIDPSTNLPGMPAASGGPLELDPQDDLAAFVAAVVDDVQTSWSQLFQAAGRQYELTKLVLFSGSTRSACGGASAETGPFYCPADRKVYLDLDFFREMEDRFQAPGDFAEAYVIAHEFGHHVQNLLGIENQVTDEERSHPDQQNELSVRLELQADCFAGVWAFSAYQHEELEVGDLQEALDAAAAVGDDRLQRQSGGRVNPDTFTHGTSEQRVRWFRNGFQSGDSEDCDTYSGDV